MSKKDDHNQNNSNSDAERLDIESTEADASASSKSSADNVSAELEKVRNDYLYLRAEFDNYRKNVLKERSDLIKYGSEHLLRDILNVVDIFDSALKTELTADNLDSFRKGFEMVAHELKSTLTRFGVKEDNPVGQAFDPNQHEALSSEESSSLPPGHITKVFKKAFRLHDKLIRPAQVIVAKEPSKDSSQ